MSVEKLDLLDLAAVRDLSVGCKTVGDAPPGREVAELVQDVELARRERVSNGRATRASPARQWRPGRASGLMTDLFGVVGPRSWVEE